MSATQSSTTVIRTAFALEALANIFGAACMLAYPTQILTWAMPSSLLPDSPSPLAKTLLTWLAGLTIGLTPQLLLSLPDTPRAKAGRWIVYTTLGAGEAALVALMAWSGITRTEDAIGMSKKTLWVCGGNLGGIVLWRIYAMVWHPEWFEGKGVEITEQKKR